MKSNKIFVSSALICSGQKLHLKVTKIAQCTPMWLANELLWELQHDLSTVPGYLDFLESYFRKQTLQKYRKEEYVQHRVCFVNVKFMHENVAFAVFA